MLADLDKNEIYVIGYQPAPVRTHTGLLLEQEQYLAKIFWSRNNWFTEGSIFNIQVTDTCIQTIYSKTEYPEMYL